VATREAVLGLLADRLSALELGHPVRVGIDGICGAGKTTFARDLAAVLTARGSRTITLSSDGFHNVRTIRYRQGRLSARGYYEDAYDFDALAEQVLEPLGPRGDLTYASAVHDLATDEVLTDSIAHADPDAILVFDCTFLQRAELRHLWDEVIFLDVSRPIARARGIMRDTDALGGDTAATAAYDDRYLAAWDLYVADVNPRDQASVIIRHDDPTDPTILPPTR
jgi:uridine kinase